MMDAFKKLFDLNPMQNKRLPTTLFWQSNRLPTRWVVPDRMNRLGLVRPGKTPCNITHLLTRICEDICQRSPTFQHVKMDKILVTFTASKSSSQYGLQARLTPLRLEDSKTEVIKRGKKYRVQQFKIDHNELLYLVTFCMPRFLDLPYEEKLITIFHELYHIGEKFDGDIRRHEGRCHVHTGSKKSYDEHMAKLVREYLANHPNRDQFGWLNMNYDELWAKHEGIFGVVLPRPRLIMIVE